MLIRFEFVIFSLGSSLRFNRLVCIRLDEKKTFQNIILYVVYKNHFRERKLSLGNRNNAKITKPTIITITLYIRIVFSVQLVFIKLFYNKICLR